MKKHLPLYAVIMLFLLTPCMAYANLGTALMWAAFFYMFIGNAIIGIAEGLFLGLLLKLRLGIIVLVMIAANYFSAWVGSMLTSFIGHQVIQVGLYNVVFFLWLTALISFGVTLLLEFPFVYLTQRKQKIPLKKLFGVFFLSQLLSCLVLFWFFFSASSFSLLENTHIDRSLSFLAESDAALYYISTEDGDVYFKNLASSDGATKVFDLNATNRNSMLFVFPSEEDQNLCLWSRIETEDRGKPEIVKVLDDFTTRSVSAKAQKIEEVYARSGNNIADLRSDSLRKWDRPKGIYYYGFALQNTSTRAVLWLDLETPFFSRHPYEATIIPGDIVIFQLGQEICALECDTRKIGVIAEGRGSVVVLK